VDPNVVVAVAGSIDITATIGIGVAIVFGGSIGNGVHALFGIPVAVGIAISSCRPILVGQRQGGRQFLATAVVAIDIGVDIIHIATVFLFVSGRNFLFLFLLLFLLLFRGFRQPKGFLFLGWIRILEGIRCPAKVVGVVDRIAKGLRKSPRAHRLYRVVRRKEGVVNTFVVVDVDVDVDIVAVDIVAVVVVAAC